MYKWGIVNKQAGHATLSLKSDASKYDMMLTAASEPWADKFYMVRDTLIGEVDKSSFRPLVYKKLSHEGGEHKQDIVVYSYSGKTVTGKCTRKKWDKKYNLILDEKRTLTASGTTIDMLTAFYYMRKLAYPSMKAGQIESVNIFSGKRKEILTIRYLGQESVKVDNKTYDTYHISFTFYNPDNPNQQTSDPMEAWISSDSQRIPIKLEGKLKVGKVQCFYTGSN